MRIERFTWDQNSPLILHNDVADAFDPDEPRDPHGRWTSGGDVVEVERRGDKVIVYHGTSQAAVDAIKREGLKPKGSEGADEWARQHGLSTSHQEFTAGDRKLNVYFADSPEHAMAFAKLASEVRKSKPALFEIDLPISEASKVSFDEAGDIGMLKYKGTIKPEWLKEIKIPPAIIRALKESPPLVEVARHGKLATDADSKRIYAIVFEPVDGD